MTLLNQTKIFFLFFITLAFPLPNSHSQELQTTNIQSTYDSKHSVLDVPFSEIFLKGSIDGQSLFLVLGMEDAQRIVGNVWKRAAQGKDFVAIGKHIYNKEHDDDFAYEWKDGWKNTKGSGSKIFSSPWKSLKDIPTSFRVNFDRAGTAYYGSKNQALGIMKASGWATWAVIEGAYYLVLEAPISFSAHILATLVELPLRTALQVVTVSWDIAKIALKFTYGITATALTESYSLSTASVATALAAVATGGYLVFRGGKFLVYDTPKKLWYPVSVQAITTIDFDQQEAIAVKVNQFIDLNPLVFDNSLPIQPTEIRVGKYKSTFIWQDENGKEAAHLMIGVQKKKLALTLKTRRQFITKMKSILGSSRKESNDIAKQISENYLAQLTQAIMQ